MSEWLIVAPLTERLNLPLVTQLDTWTAGGSIRDGAPRN